MMIDDFHREVQAADEAQLGTLDGMAKKRVCQRNQGGCPVLLDCGILHTMKQGSPLTSSLDPG